MRCLLLGALVLLLGCKEVVTRPTYQESLLQTCPESLPHEYGKTGKEWIRMAKEWSSIYHDCSLRHNGLVRAIKDARVP